MLFRSQDDGFVKVYVREGSDSIIGATIVAARASEMINEMSVIMSAGIGMRQLANIVHAYPAQSDAIRLAASAYVAGQPVSGGRRTKLNIMTGAVFPERGLPDEEHDSPKI